MLQNALESWRASRLITKVALLLAAVVVVVVAADAAYGPSLTPCEREFRDAARISDYEDSVSDLDGAIRACQTVNEWTLAAAKHPGAIDGPARPFLLNRCQHAPELRETALCKAVR